MKKPQAPATLRRLFTVILDEAASNPAFADKLIEALAVVAPQPDIPASACAEKRPSAPEVHAINVLRSHGEAVLRGKLEQIKARTELKAVATASGLVLSGCKTNASRGELIDCIIAAAKHYDAQRTIASS